MKTSYTILYVDDDTDDLILISEAFEKYTDHLRVIHAHNGREGLEVLKSMSYNKSLPCLIILDINMPIMDGKQTLKHIKENERYKDIPVVMFSTSNSQEDKQFARNLGADYIIKPLKYKDLESLVEEFVKRCLIEVSS